MEIFQSDMLSPGFLQMLLIKVTVPEQLRLNSVTILLVLRSVRV